MATRIVLKTGLFRKAHAAWRARRTMGKTWYDFQVLMREQCCLHCLTLALAGSFGYGNNAHDTAEDAAFKSMVANAGAAQATNQGVVQTLVQRNNAQAISIAQMQQQIAALAAGGPLPSAQPAQYQQQWQQLYQQQYPPPRRQQRYGQGAGHGNGRGGGGQGNRNTRRGGGRGSWAGYQQPGTGWLNQQQGGGQTNSHAHLGPRPPNVKNFEWWKYCSTNGHDCNHSN